MLPLTLPPSPINPNLVGTGLGSYNVNDYYPLTHLVKLATAYKRTLSNPYLVAIDAI